MSHYLLLVEDDVSLGETLLSRLEKQGYKIDWAQNLAEARSNYSSNQYDLILLDVGLPDGSGFDFAKEVNKTPFIFLTARNNAEDRLTGYEIGAVEYIPKPFHLKELLMRVERVIGSQKKLNQITVDSYLIDFDSMRITTPSGDLIQPTAKDFKLLTYLIENAPKVISRDEILDNFWGENNYPSSRTIDNSIVRLRQIFEDTNDIWIKSIRGVGYQWIKD